MFVWIGEANVITAIDDRRRSRLQWHATKLQCLGFLVGWPWLCSASTCGGTARGPPAAGSEVNEPVVRLAQVAHARMLDVVEAAAREVALCAARRLAFVDVDVGQLLVVVARDGRVGGEREDAER